MNSIFPRPVLLAVVVVAVLAAILFVQWRFATSSPDMVNGEPRPVSRPVEETTQQETMMQDETGTVEETTQQEAMREETTVAESDPEEERIAEKEEKYELAKEIASPSGFINTDADGVTISENLGDRVVLLDFWAYSCFNCQNTQPYLNAWQDEYADDGLVIIGVHKPEFEFEKDYAGVEQAVRQAGIEYPVVLDNEDATWDAYDQRFWPTMYLIDSDGFVRYKHIGEGAYDETEATIRELLAERDENAG